MAYFEEGKTNMFIQFWKVVRLLQLVALLNPYWCFTDQCCTCWTLSLVTGTLWQTPAPYMGGIKCYCSARGRVLEPRVLGPDPSLLWHSTLHWQPLTCRAVTAKCFYDHLFQRLDVKGCQTTWSVGKIKHWICVFCLYSIYFLTYTDVSKLLCQLLVY